ncbi:MAG: DNA gyrase inhibitor YacG [Pseudomonadota bacterium]
MGSRSVNCPQCGEAVAWSTSNRFRPFCSQRCRTLDLGAWASEAYRVPEPPAPPADGDD